MFSGFLTEHFDDFALEEPAFATLRRVVEAFALLDWLSSAGGLAATSWADNLSSPAKTPTRLPVTRISLDLRSVDQLDHPVTTIINVEGGVSLGAGRRVHGVAKAGTFENEFLAAIEASLGRIPERLEVGDIINYSSPVGEFVGFVISSSS